MANNPQENAIGVNFIVTVEEDGAPKALNGAIRKDLVFVKPDGSTFTRTADFFTDGTDGKLKYITIAGDLTPAGRVWKLQADLKLTNGYDGRTGHDEFTVEKNS